LSPIEIFGHSDDSCWGIMATDQGVMFGRKDDLKPMGYAFGAKKALNMAITYSAASKTLKGFFDTPNMDNT